MPVIQLMLLFLVMVAVRSLIPLKNKTASLVLSFFLALIFTIQLSSVVLTGEIADYRFYENFNPKDVLSVADFFGSEGLLLALVLTATTLIIHFLGNLVGQKIRKKTIPVSVLLLGLALMSFDGGILKNAYSTLALKLAGDASLAEAMVSLKIEPEHYVEKDEIRAAKGKNIIVLSLESLEKAYLSDKLKHLTPNLTRLSQDHSLIKMEQCPGGSWTSASMYVALTGVPAYFSTHGNSIFQSSHENKLTSLPDILKKAGYDLQYFVGKKEYSGIDDMLKTHGFTVKSEKDFITKYDPVAWGIQDMDLFAEFKKELLSRKNSDKPFAMFLSTIGTHFPNGVPDKRIDSLLPPQKSRLELMVSATDYFVGDLINFLEKEGMLSNTAFFIYPDHLLMGRKSRVVEDFDERSLYLLTNAELDELTTSKNESIYQIDLPKLILKGAEIEHNVKFLTEYISEPDKNKFIRKHAKALTQLNEAALTTLNLKQGFMVEADEDGIHFLVKDGDGSLVLKEKLPDAGNCHRILLDEALRPMENVVVSFENRGAHKPNISYLDVFNTPSALYAVLNGTKNYGLTKKGRDEISFDKKDITLFEEVNSSVLAAIVLSSNSWNAKRGSSFIVDGKKEAISRGLTILCFNSQSKLDYRTFDTYGRETEVQEFVSMLSKLETDGTKFAILAHDSAAKALAKFSQELKKMGFGKLSTLKDRQAYVMHNLNDDKVERVDDLSINIQLAFPKNIVNSTVYFEQTTKIDFENRTDRYIAHAGGQIDGIKYTNSKEALNLSYTQGFRLFELDISETSDGHFVATHDWNHWAKETGFQGKVPVDLKEFRKHKIRKKYSPMGMNEINEWFSEHPDAVLVTDKVNSPKKFGDRFIDKDRLVMELFSLAAVEEALQNGIRPLLSEKALSEIKGDPLTYLLDNKIEYIGHSRKTLSTKKDLLRKCRENNIMVYVYHVNFDAGRDEKYVFENEIGRVYGMYADKWLSEFNSEKKEE